MFVLALIAPTTSKAFSGVVVPIPILSAACTIPNDPVESALPLIFVPAEPPVIVNLSLIVDPVYV